MAKMEMSADGILAGIWLPGRHLFDFLAFLTYVIRCTTLRAGASRVAEIL